MNWRSCGSTLNKDHAWRHGQLSVSRRGLICYNFEDDFEGLRSTPLRIYPPLFGASSTTTVPWGAFFPTVKTNDYLFAYGAGGGSYYTCAGIGSSDDFALNDIKAVFTFFFGSYFGDWDNESNFLRASLGSTSYTLTASWAGRPHWFMHPMAMGETIGYVTRLTQNNQTNGLYQPYNLGTREVHVALMGDPTLRLHPVIPPSNLLINETTNGFNLTWNESAEADLLGYYVYKSDSDAGPFTRISGTNPISETNFTDTAGVASSVYMLRAVKLESSPSGTYYNLSQGIFVRPFPLPSAPGISRAAPRPQTPRSVGKIIPPMNPAFTFIGRVLRMVQQPESPHWLQMWFRSVIRMSPPVQIIFTHSQLTMQPVKLRLKMR